MAELQSEILSDGKRIFVVDLREQTFHFSCLEPIANVLEQSTGLS